MNAFLSVYFKGPTKLTPLLTAVTPPSCCCHTPQLLLSHPPVAAATPPFSISVSPTQSICSERSASRSGQSSVRLMMVSGIS